MQYTLFILLISTFIGLNGLANAEVKKRVFLLASYEENHVCGGPQESGIISGLSREGWFRDLNLEVEFYYMDTKRKNNTPESMQAEAKLVIDRIKDFKPQVLITIDDNAFREVALTLAGEKNISVVFSGLNDQPEFYNQLQPFMGSRKSPGGNITGVYEKLYIKRSLDVIQRSVGGTKGSKYIGITDYSPTGNAITKQFQIELATVPEGLSWEIRRVKNWQEYTDLINLINRDEQVKAIYPVALTLMTPDNKTYTAPEIFDWTIHHSKKPEMALNYYFSQIGLFGGAAVDFRAMGFLAGKKAGKILNGSDAGDIPIEDAPEYAIVFNLNRAKSLGIEIPLPLLTAADHVYK